jgi:hypothetical protein
MHCQYCKKRLGIFQLLKGQSFCSAEHQELHFGLSFERLRESVAEFTPSKPKLELSKAKPELAPAPAELEPVQAKAEPTPAELQPALAKPVQTQAGLEQAPTTSVAELHARLVAQQASQAVETVKPVEAVKKTTGTDLPEAPFLHELPSRQDQPASPLKSNVTVPMISASVQLPVSPIMPVRPTREIPPGTLPSPVLNVSPAQSPVEATPAAKQATWLFVPQGYPPVVVSASATLVLDSNGAALIPLPLSEPCSGERPAPPPQTDAIEIPTQQPRLPSWQTDRRAAPLSALFAPPPLAPACEAVWKARLGLGPAFPPLAGILRPQRDLERLVSPVRPANYGALASYPFFAAEPDFAVSPKELRVTPAEYLPAPIRPLRTLLAEQALATSRVLALAKATNLLTIENTTPLRWKPSSDEINFAWLRMAADSRLPQGDSFPPSTPIGLSPVQDIVPLGCSSATNFPLPVKTVAAVMSAVPFLLPSRRLPISSPTLPLSSGARPLWRGASRLPVTVNERQSALSVAYLHPSSPSPWSLVTWSRSLSISIPACNPSNLGRPAAIGVSPIQGRPQALRPWTPSRRAYRLTPLMPQPGGVTWTPVAPMQASLRPPAIHPIRPGPAGTAPPCLATVRAQPASMPVLPPVLAPFGIEPATAVVVFRPSFDGTLKMACMDVAHGISRASCELRVESSTVLPSFSAGRHAPAIGMALGSQRAWWRPMPPSQTVGTVQPFSDLRRLALSVTAGLPGAQPAGLTSVKA